MRLQYVPLLAVQRAIYDTPRDMTRFKEYLKVLVGDSKDWPALAPLVAANPMAREHVTQLLDELLALKVDDHCAAATEDAARRLWAVEGDFRVSLVVADDVKGGWTDRHLTEASARFEGAKTVKHGWATGLLWASEPASASTAREETVGALYRAAHVARHGDPRTLRAAMLQEGRALAFAGASGPVLSAAASRSARVALAPHLDLGIHAALIAGMYGDDVARKCGHKPLGVPDRAGFALGLEDARAEGDPVNALLA